MVIKKCVGCGNGYNVKPSRVNKSKYCSQRCSRKARATGRKIIKCKRCGRIKQLGAFGMCSSCYSTYWKNKKTNKQKVKCLICGLDFVGITQAHLKKFHNTTVKEYKKKFPNCKLSLEPIGVQILQKQDLKRFKEHQSKASKNVTLETRKKNMEAYKKWEASLTPEERYLLRRKKGLATVKKYPNLFKENLKQWRLNHPEDYKKLQSEAGKKAALKLLEFLKEHPEIYALAGQKSFEALRKGQPYLWEGVAFSSNEEREIAKLLLDKPLDGVNTQVKIKYYTIDFFPKQKVFVEYHPNLYDHNQKKCLTKAQYKAPRIKTIKESKYKDKRIEFIFDSLKNDREKVLDQIKKIKEEYNL